MNSMICCLCSWFSASSPSISFLSFIFMTIRCLHRYPLLIIDVNCLLCWFSTAIITHYHKFSSLNNTNLLFYISVGQKSHTDFSVSLGLCSALIALGDNQFLCLFQLPEVCTSFRLCSPSLICKASTISILGPFFIVTSVSKLRQERFLILRTHVIRFDQLDNPG